MRVWAKSELPGFLLEKRWVSAPVFAQMGQVSGEVARNLFFQTAQVSKKVARNSDSGQGIFRRELPIYTRGPLRNGSLRPMPSAGSPFCFRRLHRCRAAVSTTSPPRLPTPPAAPFFLRRRARVVCCINNAYGCVRRPGT